MRTVKPIALAVGAALVGLTGCQGAAPTRTITGQLAVSAYATAPSAVVALSTARKTYLSSIATDGKFKIVVPARGTYRLTLATPAQGVYLASSRVTFASDSGRARWAHVAAGAVVQLGGIRPVQAVTTAGLAPLAVPSSSSTYDAADRLRVDGGHGDDAAAGADDDDEHELVECEGADVGESAADDVDVAGVTGDDGAQGEAEADADMIKKCRTAIPGSAPSTAP
jgi:hypothetical protein